MYESNSVLEIFSSSTQMKRRVALAAFYRLNSKLKLCLKPHIVWGPSEKSLYTYDDRITQYDVSLIETIFYIDF